MKQPKYNPIILSAAVSNELSSCKNTEDLINVFNDMFANEDITAFADALLAPEMDIFIRTRMTYDMALDMIAAEGKTVIEDLELTSPQIVDAIGIYYHNDINYSTENPNTLPYILCMEYPTAATSLYEELKYWASKGRI